VDKFLFVHHFHQENREIVITRFGTNLVTTSIKRDCHALWARNDKLFDEVILVGKTCVMLEFV